MSDVIRDLSDTIAAISRRVKRLEAHSPFSAPSGGGGAPVNGPYVTYAADATLTNENLLDDGAGLTLTIAGGYATMALTLPGDVTSTSVNTSVGNHTHALDATGVVPGIYPASESYTPLITVDSKGRITDLDSLLITIDPANLTGATAQYQYIVTGAAPLFTPAWSTGRLNIAAAQTLVITTGGTLALGGFTGTLPAIGTFALMDYANVTNFGVGVTPTENIQIIGNIRIPAATATVGIIKQGVNRLLHTYNLNTFLGALAGNFTTTGEFNVGLGKYTLFNLTGGSFNVCVGDYAGYNLTTGLYNILIGLSAGRNSTDTDRNTVIGYEAGFVGAIGQAGCVFLGHSAGYYETGNNKLFIDNTIRANEADGRLKALVYGVFNGVVANQYFTVNGNFIATGTITLSGWTFGLTGNTTITNGGTLALGGYTLTIPATGTPALMDYANVGNLYTVPWTDYSATSTIVGWSSFTTKLISYKKVGNLVFFWFFLQGTSNSTTVSFTLPYTSVNAFGEGLVSRAQDNGVKIATACAWELAGAVNIVNCYKDHDLGAWTNAGTKRVIGQGWYEAA